MAFDAARPESKTRAPRLTGMICRRCGGASIELRVTQQRTCPSADQKSAIRVTVVQPVCVDCGLKDCTTPRAAGSSPANARGVDSRLGLIG